MASKGLKKSSQFGAVYRDGRREAGRKLVIYYLLKDGGGTRAGFVASRKKVGKAYQRNRAKRLLREVFRRLNDSIVEKDIWIVFIASFRPAETSFQELLEEAKSSLARAGLISSDG
jgi:ribonuclease P protein component